MSLLQFLICLLFIIPPSFANQQAFYSLKPKTTLMPYPLGEMSYFFLHFNSPPRNVYRVEVSLDSTIQWQYNFTPVTVAPPRPDVEMDFVVDALNETAFLIGMLLPPRAENNILTVALVPVAGGDVHYLYQEKLLFERELWPRQPVNGTGFEAGDVVEVRCRTKQPPGGPPPEIFLPCGNALTGIVGVPDLHRPYDTVWSTQFRLSRTCPLVELITIVLTNTRKVIQISVRIPAQVIDIHGPETMYMTGSGRNQLHCDSDNRPPLPVNWHVVPLPQYRHPNFSADSSNYLPSAWRVSTEDPKTLILQNSRGSDLILQPAQRWGAVGSQMEFKVTCFVNLTERHGHIRQLSQSRIITVFTETHRSYELTLEVIMYSMLTLTGLVVLILFCIACCRIRRRRRRQRWDEELNSDILSQQAQKPSSDTNTVQLVDYPASWGTYKQPKNGLSPGYALKVETGVGEQSMSPPYETKMRQPSFSSFSSDSSSAVSSLKVDRV